MRSVRSVPTLALAVLWGCAGPLSRAESQFAEGRYPEAKQTLETVESDSRSWNDSRRAEYALYRGLTHAALGDREQAATWRHEARAIEDAHPGSLSPEDARRLKAAFEAGQAE
jgi:hypothetical protein